MNILDDVESVVSPAGSLPLWKVRAFVLPDSAFDLAVIPLCREAQTPEATSRVIDRLRASELITDIKPRKKHQVHVRIDTASLEGRGAKLEAGEFPAANDLEAGRSYVVHFCDPNATKALHVGHLRNIALGNAIASALAYAGATVQRRSVVGDIGRNMAETIAALWPIRDTISAELAGGGEKADHLVGRHYARQASAEQSDPAPASAVDIPLSQETAVRHDLADEMLLQMLHCDGEVIHTSATAVRDSVVSAQLATPSRAFGVEARPLVSCSSRPISRRHARSPRRAPWTGYSYASPTARSHIGPGALTLPRCRWCAPTGCPPSTCGPSSIGFWPTRNCASRR